ncbi:Class E vacuolar protein-sorting machinery protein [Hortaea werneckii]|nr:Class E vacuolar protein-sorting machinery protein [Hortaea werneckii]
MFRAQANPMDDAVVKATDENLTSENWEYILDVCDRVAASSSGPPHAVSALIKRLAHRNANVQLYTLELANALSQNCGPPLHRELASKAFTDALLRLANDRNTHAQVKQKVLERMGSWSDEFRKDPDLGIMDQAYQRLRTTQPGLMPPSKPGKQQISSDDRRKEEEELQMALALSVQDKGGNQAASPGRDEGPGAASERDDSEPQPAQAQPGAQQGTTAATVSRVKALYDFTPSEPGELAFRKDDVIAVLESVYKDWWKGSLRGQTGIFPLNYVEKLQDPTKEDLERDANMEAEVFGEIKNVEKLLALLSVRDGGGSGRRGEREEEEIGDLYQRTLSIRPKLIELIGRYSQKKDDFTQLNEKFIKARRDYEALLESSMSHPPHPYQQQQQFPIRTPQASHPMYPPPQQRQPYGAPPPAGYPPQGPPPTSAQGYPPQQPPFTPAQSQPHLPHQDPQRFYSPAPPSEPPLSAGGGPPQGFATSPYPPHDGPPIVNGAAGGASAPFHFIPGGVQQQHQQLPPPHQQQPQQQQEVRRKPSPQDFGAPPPPGGGLAADPAAAGGGGGGAGGFQGQIRPNSIHTLNRGDPQELATSVYESPVDHQRGSYPVGGADGYAPQQQQQFPQQQAVGGPGAPPPAPLSGDQRESFYQYPPPAHPHPSSGGAGAGVPNSPGGGGGAGQMMSPSSPPSAGLEPGSTGGPAAGQGGYPPSAAAPGFQYQAYQPPPPQQQQQQMSASQGEFGWSQQQQQQYPQQQYPQQHEQQRLPSGSSAGGGGEGGDPGDFYR